MQAKALQGQGRAGWRRFQAFRILVGSGRPGRYPETNGAKPMEFSVAVVADDRLETTNEAGQRFTFPLDELRATRKPPRSDVTVGTLPVSLPLRTLELARKAAEDYAVAHHLI